MPFRSLNRIFAKERAIIMKKTISNILYAAILALIFISCSNSKNADDNGGNPYENVHSMADLEGYKVAVIGGSFQEIYMMEHHPKAQLARFNSVTELITAVDNGVSDVFLIDGAGIIGAGLERKKMGHCFSDSTLSGNYGFAFRHDDQELCTRFNKFMSQMQADGTMDDIRQRWIDGDANTAKMPEIAFPDSRPLVIGTQPFFPFSFVQEGKVAGFEADILRRFAKSEGRNIRTDFLDFGALIAALLSGKIDIIASCMTITDERAKQVLFSNPYYFSITECYGHVDKTPQGNVAGGKGIGLMERIQSNLIEEQRWKLLVDGFKETLFISFFSILFGTMVGALICWMRMIRNKFLNGLAKIYVEIMRGIPILVFLMIMFYIVFASSKITARWVAVFAFSLNFGAYVSEMFRTGIESVDKGQSEAGWAMGFSKMTTFLYFIVPQTLKSIIPVYKGEAISLIKNTSIVGYIAIQDLTKASDIIRSRTFDAFFPLILISTIYFILAWIFGKLLDRLATRNK